MSALALAVGTLSVLAPQVARAQGHKVQLDIQVVEASTQGKHMDPRLAHMESDFRAKGFAFSSYTLVSAPSQSVAPKGTATVALPNGKSAQLTVVGKEANGMIKMHLAVRGVGLNVDYSVRSGGRSFFGAGPGQTPGSQVFMVITHTAK